MLESEELSLRISRGNGRVGMWAVCLFASLQGNLSSRETYMLWRLAAASWVSASFQYLWPFQLTFPMSICRQANSKPLLSSVLGSKYDCCGEQLRTRLLLDICIKCHWYIYGYNEGLNLLSRQPTCKLCTCSGKNSTDPDQEIQASSHFH